MKQNLQPPATPLEMLRAQFENLGELVKNTIFVGQRIFLVGKLSFKRIA